MNARTSLAVALVSCTLGCVAETASVSRTREALDEYVIEKPLAQAWVDALRFLNARGYPPVGADRKLLGLPEMGSWSTAASKGSETTVSGTRWTADTQVDARERRYRIIGVDLGATSCRIGFFAVTQEVSGESPKREMMFRDTTAELAFVETLDPQGAARMRPKDPGFF